MAVTVYLCLLVTGACGADVEAAEERFEQVQVQTAEAEQKLRVLLAQVDEREFQLVKLRQSIRTQTRINAGAGVQYILTVQVKQEGRTPDLRADDSLVSAAVRFGMKKSKDAWNAFELEIPVSKEFYDHHKVGDKLGEGFRWGSFVLRGGSTSSTVVRVKDKRIEAG